MTKSISSKELLRPAKTQGELMSYRQGYATGLVFGKRHSEILRSQNARLIEALAESVRLQSHYAALLNQYDGGNRKGFADTDEWLHRLAEIATQEGKS